jgi:lariat debranching enzyme
MRIDQDSVCAVGGNHEACNHLWELYYGGWAAPNIRYLGHAGVINFGGLRIGGLSGIFKPKDYATGHFERPPYTDSTMRSAYHVRDLEVYRLLKARFCCVASSDSISDAPCVSSSDTS